MHFAASGCNCHISELDCIGVELLAASKSHQDTRIDADVVSPEQPSALPHEGLVVFGLVPE